MNHFISNIISRHLAPANDHVIPRLPGRFEPGEGPINIHSHESLSVSENIPAQVQRKKQLLPTVSIETNPKKENTLSQVHLLSTEFKNENNSQEKKIDSDTTETMPGPVSLNQINKPGSIVDTTDVDLQTGQSLFSGKEYHKHNTDTEPSFITRNNRSTGNHEGKDDNNDLSIQPSGVIMKPSPIVTNKNKLREDKPSGILGEPPGADFYTNAETGKNAFSNEFAEQTKPVIKISIGQINVRAINPTAVAVAKKPAQVIKPALSLEEYLKQQSKR